MTSFVKLNYPSIKVLVTLIVLMTCLNSCQLIGEQPDRNAIKQMISQKIMLDIRYFCQQKPVEGRCKKAVTTLPTDLAKTIKNNKLGGIILFKENLQSQAQINQLTQDLQSLSRQGGFAPLFIGVDQEGGRVVRLPTDISTQFAGNMAIGATWDKHGDHFATASGKAIAKELKLLGINLNFAPTLDVNVNPDNPVINVRSFSEDPEQVAQLGTAQMRGMQSQGMMTALKHFPGHGDTSVDSHTGLPLVEHDEQSIFDIDLYPFIHAINHATPDMIMTAHIQYPNLDNTRFIAKNGSETVLPATMSYDILTKLLRQRLQFKGLIITDALDMAGIAHYYQPTQALINTFAAGADIALMPFTIRTPEDIPKFEAMLESAVDAVINGTLDKTLLKQSVSRITALKQKYNLNSIAQTAAAKHATEMPIKQHRVLEQQLANQSLVMTRNNGVIPFSPDVKKLTLFMPDAARCSAMTNALLNSNSSYSVNCINLARGLKRLWKVGHDTDVVILGDISPQQSLAEMGGMDDFEAGQQRDSLQSIQANLKSIAKQANNAEVPVVFVAFRAPYILSEFSLLSDAQLATLSYNITSDSRSPDKQKDSAVIGPVFLSLAAAFNGTLTPTGTLPVTIN